jgi:glycine cleavage system H protein
MKTPENLKYAKTDEWVKMDGNLATLGISDYAQDQLSDIVYIEFAKDAGDSIAKDEIISTIESVKAAGDVVAPFSGKIIEVNESLADKPELINSDPYGIAWIYKIEVNDSTGYDSLMNASEYESYCVGRH